MRRSAPLSVIIPTLNAGAHLAACLDSLLPGLADGMIREAIICDGGSDDDTLAIADQAGCHIINSPRGRGQQLQAGAKIARGSWLLFLHADTRLAPGWTEHVFAHMASNHDCAACFRLVLDSPVLAARSIEHIVSWRVALMALPYGDQGLLLSRRLHDRVGGYNELPIMEDVDMVRRLGRRRLRSLPCAAISSAEKYHRDGWWRRSSSNALLLLRYLLGVDPRILARQYS